MTVEERTEELRAVLRAVPGYRYHQDVGPGVTPPATVLGVPILAWDGVCHGPQNATWLVWVVVDVDTERAADQLIKGVQQVALAIEDGIRDAVVSRAVPTTYPGDESELPAYEITVEVAL